MDFLALLSNPFVEVLALGAASGLMWYARRRAKRLPIAITMPNWGELFDRICDFGKPHPAWQPPSRHEEPPKVEPSAPVERESLRQAPPVAPRPAAQAVRSASGADEALWLTEKPKKAPKIKLSQVAQADNIAVIGQKGSGKTTLLLTLLANRRSDYIALDPHNAPQKWPCQVVGGGRDYLAIKTVLQNLDAAMNKRFGQLNSGEVAEGMFARRTLVADEFRSIAQNVPVERGEKGAGRYILDRISEGRKVAEAVLLAGHNDTVVDLGIEGSSSMKSCFDFIIYTAGIAVQRYGSQDRGNAPSEFVRELEAMERPMLVWATTHNQWAILDFDLVPVFAPQVSTVSVVPAAGTGNWFPVCVCQEPVPEPQNQFPQVAEPVPDGTGLDAEVINALHSAGWSNNRIASKLTGRREDRLARIRRALGDSETASAA